MKFAQALQVLLHRPEGERIQVMYVKLANGKVLVFLGAPVSEEDFAQIDDIVLGECVSPATVGMAAMFGETVRSQ